MIKAIETRYNGYHFRSRAEARWAVFFDAIGLHYEYEKEGYELECGRYLPDFWLPDLKYWFEVKGQNPTADEIIKAGFLYTGSGFPVLIAVGAPAPKRQLLHVPIYMTKEEAYRGSGSVAPRFMIADDRRNDNEFWLLDPEEDAYWLGPNCGPDHGKWPLVHRATANGYVAARSARFEFLSS